MHALCNAHITEMKLLKMVSNKRNNATNKVPLEPKKNSKSHSKIWSQRLLRPAYWIEAEEKPSYEAMSKELDAIANTSRYDRSIKHTCHGQILNYGDPSSTLIFKPWWNSLGYYSRSSTVYPSEDNAVVFSETHCLSYICSSWKKLQGQA